MNKHLHQFVRYTSDIFFFFALLISVGMFSACGAVTGKGVTQWQTSDVYDVSCFKNKVFALRIDFSYGEWIYNQYWTCEETSLYTQNADCKIAVPNQTVFSNASLQLFDQCPIIDDDLSTLTIDSSPNAATFNPYEGNHNIIIRIYRAHELYFTYFLQRSAGLTNPDDDPISQKIYAILMIDESKFPHADYQERLTYWFGNFDQTPIFW